MHLLPPALAGLLLAAAAQPALACRCAVEQPSPERMTADGARVLRGQIMEAVREGGPDINEGRILYRLRVRNAVNLGIAAGEEVWIATAPNGALCGVTFHATEVVLVKVTEQGGDHVTDICMQAELDVPAWHRHLNRLEGN